MQYLTSAEIASIWKVSERSVRNYCNKGRVPGAVLNGKMIGPPMLKRANKVMALVELIEEFKAAGKINW